MLPGQHGARRGQGDEIVGQGQKIAVDEPDEHIGKEDGGGLMDPAEVADALPPEAAEVIEELGEESSDFSRGLRIIGEKLQALLPDYLRRGLRSAGVLLGICAVCTTAEGSKSRQNLFIAVS